MIKNKSILVTGGAGFIGSHLFEKLMSEDNFVIIIDNFNNHYSGKEKNIAEITSSYKQDKDYDLIKGDLLDKEVYKKINNNIDLIFHIAALPGVRYSIQNTELVSKNNIIGTLNVFEYALQNKVSKVNVHPPLRFMEIQFIPLLMKTILKTQFLLTLYPN